MTSNPTFRPYDRARLTAWYDAHAEGYDEQTFRQTDTSYGGDLYRIELVASVVEALAPRRVLDIGCGTGEPMLRLLKAGVDVRGFDLSSGMIARAKRKLREQGYPETLVAVDDLLDPAVVERHGEASFDLVITNGVVPYIEDDATAHRHIARLVRPGGHYVGAYNNEAFDLFTLNAFTVAFHEKHFIDALPADAAAKRAVTDALRGLLSHPDEPRTIPGAREEIYVGSHNPFTIGDALRAVGLVQRDLLFYRFHAFPPLLSRRSPELARAFVEGSRAYEITAARDWRGHFLASTFIVVAERAA